MEAKLGAMPAEQPIRVANFSLSALLHNTASLMRQSQILKQQMTARLKNCAQTPQHDKNDTEHGPSSLANCSAVQ